MSNADVYISVNGSCFLENTSVTEKLSKPVMILVCDSVTVLGETGHDVIYLKAKRGVHISSLSFATRVRS